jgi:hypothetical protein
MNRTFEGIVLGVYRVRPEGESLASELIEVAEVTFAGFAGDRHAGMTMLSNSRTSFYKRGTEIWNHRQVSIVSMEELAEVAPRMGIPEIRPEWLGANLAIGGIPHLTRLPPGTRLFFPDRAVLIVQAENAPCLSAGAEIQSHYPDLPDLAAQFPKQGLHKRGIVACVERPGTIRAGEAVKVMIPEQTLYEG